MLDLTVVENCDCELVPQDLFGVQDASGNFYGVFDTRAEAYTFIIEELKC